jgi:hypothetical protein
LIGLSMSYITIFRYTIFYFQNMVNEEVLLPESLKCMLHFKKGVWSDNPNTAQIRTNAFPAQELIINSAEVFGVLKERIRQKISEINSSSLLWGNDEEIYIQLSQNHRQFQFKPISQFEDLNLVFSRLWKSSKNKAVFILKLFVFLTVPIEVSHPIPINIRRATASRIRSAVSRIRSHRQSQGEPPVGALSEMVWAQDLARQTNTETDLVVPSHNTFREAEILDRIAEEGNANEVSNYGVLNIRFGSENANDVPIFVNITDLRNLLTIPTTERLREHLRSNNADFGLNIEDEDHIESDISSS